MMASIPLGKEQMNQVSCCSESRGYYCCFVQQMSSISSEGEGVTILCPFLLT